MAKTDYLENKWLNHTLKNVTYTAPATVYAALMTTAPTDTTTGTEVTGGSYARQAITFGTPSTGSASNTLAVNFSAIPAGTVTHIAIFDALTSGNMLYYQALSSSIVATAGSDVEFGVGDITVIET